MDRVLEELMEAHGRTGVVLDKIRNGTAGLGWLKFDVY